MESSTQTTKRNEVEVKKISDTQIDKENVKDKRPGTRSKKTKEPKLKDTNIWDFTVE